jgi:hypothetical protein
MRHTPTQNVLDQVRMEIGAGDEGFPHGVDHLIVLSLSVTIA